MNYSGTGIGTGTLVMGTAGVATGSVILLAFSVTMLVIAGWMTVRRIGRTAPDQRQ